jgi:regulator of replication initiation timing
MIEEVGKIITDNEDLKIDVKKLRDEGASLKIRMQEIIRSVQDQQQQADHQVTQEEQQQQKIDLWMTENLLSSQISLWICT